MMISRSTIFLDSIFLLSIIICMDVGYSVDPITSCPKETEYKLNSSSGRAYKNNVESLLSELSSKASNPNGFYNFTAVRAGAATAYGLVYCYGGEATPTECQTCVETVSSEILRDCSNTTWAVSFGQFCMVRYSNESIFSQLDTNPVASQILCETATVPNTTLLNQVLSEEFYEIIPEAANGGVSGRKYAFRESKYSLFQKKVYSLGQCTPDLTGLDCKSCLSQAVQMLPRYCNGKAGGTILFPSCRVRWEMYPFIGFIQTPPLAPIPRPATNLGNGRILKYVVLLFIKFLVFLLTYLT